MAYIYDLGNKKLIEAEIILASGKMPFKKDGWKFDWNKLLKVQNTKTYILKSKDESQSIEGILQLKIENDMLIMDVIEIAPHNLGSSQKRFEHVAGCLIAFACRESFKIKGNYKGFLTFVSKTNLIEWYEKKYGATLALGQRMYIDDATGLNLIKKYLH
ncbi:hypothetical protein IMCC3317_12010 [Kordia antarctica]|uniref:N-acetyltransferase domain-containing protein n=1 Tax=Kordia antarctica TaxID=1218801 RepID=A0A7L4ZGL2_9FLAO|nr:hypothetical protein [Kordia antarctica]QHI35853.1 hypothetical protein IMCC3317_12010 [Kordia antarctica]